MNFFKKKSDRDVVDALRRTERFRQPAGLAFIVLSLAFIGFHVWGEAWMRRKALQIAESAPIFSARLDRRLLIGRRPSRTPWGFVAASYSPKA